MLISKDSIHFRKWPVKNPKAVLLAVHGMGAHSQRWEEMAKFFKAKKVAVYAIELRGYGDLRQVPGHVESMDLYIKDIGILKNIIKKENPSSPVFIIGESMGAVISHMTAQEFDGDYKGLIEVSPVYQDVMDISLAKRGAIAFTAMFNPSKPIDMPFTAEMISRDPVVVKKLNKDPREIRVASAGLLLNILMYQIKIGAGLDKLKTPSLFLLAGSDKLGDVKFTMKMFAKMKNDKEMRVYKDSFHALTIDKNRKEVFGDLFSWLIKKIK
ncbi:MAG: alpha/beta fold hydrolase [Candidatus Goldiibacteriota bacterium]